MESEIHMNYVRVIGTYIKEHFPESEWSMMQIDLPEDMSHPEKVINGYRPDVIVNSSDCIIIGEAKTVKDTKNRHTREQIKSYIEELKLHSKERHLILCTSLYSLPELKNEVRRMHQEYNFSGVHIHCMDDLRIKTTVWDL